MSVSPELPEDVEKFLKFMSKKMKCITSEQIEAFTKTYHRNEIHQIRIIMMNLLQSSIETSDNIDELYEKYSDMVNIIVTRRGTM